MKNLLILEQDICKEWNYEKNKLIPENYLKASREKVWWKCDKNHEWETTIHSRVYGKTGCPFCANKKACIDNCFSTKFPDMLKEWDYEKNIMDPTNILPGSDKRIWWKCVNGHSWECVLHFKTRKNKPAFCPKCPQNFKLRSKGNSYN